MGRANAESLNSQNFLQISRGPTNRYLWAISNFELECRRHFVEVTHRETTYWNAAWPVWRGHPSARKATSSTQSEDLPSMGSLSAPADSKQQGSRLPQTTGEVGASCGVHLSEPDPGVRHFDQAVQISPSLGWG